MSEKQQNIKITINIRDMDKNIPYTTFSGHTLQYIMIHYNTIL